MRTENEVRKKAEELKDKLIDDLSMYKTQQIGLTRYKAMINTLRWVLGEIKDIQAKQNGIPLK